MEKGNEQMQVERLKEQIARAQATALPRGDLGKVLHAEAELNNLFLQGKINGEELKKNLRALNRHAGVVKTGDPREYRQILELIGLSEEAIEKFINDEMPHYEKAVEQDLKAMLRVQFFKMEEEKWGVCAQTEVTYPDELADELFRKAHRKTLEAPGEENLSTLDRKGLGLK
ncbi:MAG TPA: hypothetical protein VF043_33915 [Ktedonobacteraceae bacterium]